VSNQDQVVLTGPDGTYRLDPGGFGVVFVSIPDGWAPNGAPWRTATATTGMDFPLVPSPPGAELVFVHASDTHIAPASVARTERLRALVDSIRPAFVLITRDLVRDALRVGEGEATGYYELFNQQVERFSRPVFTVPGNHEVFGIERGKSGVSTTHPLYGRTMYRHYRGPDYYSFNAGGVHFVGLNTVDIDDMWYYGHVDSLQLVWLERDLAVVPPTTPVVTFNHIPFFSAVESINGYSDAPPAPTVITVNGKPAFRHTVSNAREVLARFTGRPYPLALGGHVHVSEQLRYAGIATRFEQAAAVVAPGGGGVLPFPSGITAYRVRRGVLGEGVFVPLGLDPPAGEPR
jgi:3',5'-cyclic AMP phosphodiesterase CpdA